MGTSRTVSAARRFPAAIVQLFAGLRTMLRQVKVHRRVRSLRICETLALGDRRLLLVIQFERKRFLIGSTNQSISLLDCLDERSHPASQPDDSRWATSTWKGPH